MINAKIVQTKHSHKIDQLNLCMPKIETFKYKGLLLKCNLILSNKQIVNLNIYNISTKDIDKNKISKIKQKIFKINFVIINKFYEILYNKRKLEKKLVYKI